MKNKKFLFFFVMIVASLFLAACTVMSQEEAQKVFDEVEAWVEENVKEGVAEDITLPTTYPNNESVRIDWLSQDPAFIDNEGHILERDRKLYEVMFTYFVSIGDLTTSYDKVFKLCPRSLEEYEERFKNQFPVFIAKDIDLTTVYNDVVTVTWWSSNEEVFSNEGKYIKPLQDTEITISYIITDGNSSLENSFTKKVQGKTAYDYFVEAQNWLENDFITDRFITGDMELPTHIGNNEDITITWTSTNDNVIAPNGKVTKTIYERYCKLTAKLQMDGATSTYSYNLVVEALDLSQMTDQEILEEFVKNIAVSEFKKLVFNSYADNTQTYGYIHFYSAKKLNVVEAIIPEGNSNRPGEINKKEYITVHDTANNNANAKAHVGYLEGGGGGTSWHYTIDDEYAYHHVPDNETAYHAGDGSRYFTLVDTGIKATAIKPIVTLKDGYWHLNGQNTGMRPYTDAAGTQNDPTNWTSDYINEMGILVEIGENGNWYMGKTWYSKSYDLIGNFGGNKNSVGIESSVHQGTDYATTVRHLAMLVAKLTIDWDLPVDRVKGHHYFSGKGCPNQIMQANYWEEFLNLVALEKFAQENYVGYTFNWTSLSANLDAQGKISLSAKAGDELSYKLSVLNRSNQEVLSGTYKTTLK